VPRFPPLRRALSVVRRGGNLGTVGQRASVGKHYLVILAGAPPTFYGKLPLLNGR